LHEPVTVFPVCLKVQTGEAVSSAPALRFAATCLAALTDHDPEKSAASAGLG
jgi:hypothetical protein